MPLPFIQPHSFLTLHYRLSRQDGLVLVDTFGQNPATLTLGTGALSPALEQKLLGMTEGQQATLHWHEGEAFGPKQQGKIQWLPVALLQQLGVAPDTPIGQVLQFPQGILPILDASAATLIAKETDGSMCFDFNHPLAGVGVTFEVEILSILD